MAVKRVAILLTTGFEEIEAVAVVDVLRRGGVEVLMAAVGVPGPLVTGSHGIAIQTDTDLAALSVETLDAVVLPGGMPGSVNLAQNANVLALLRDARKRGKWVAAICAAPLALHAAGLLAGRTVTGYPTIREKLVGALFTGARVEQDGTLLTSVAAGTAIEFGLALLACLGLAEPAATLKDSMLVK